MPSRPKRWVRTSGCSPRLGSRLICPPLRVQASSWPTKLSSPTIATSSHLVSSLRPTSALRPWRRRSSPIRNTSPTCLNSPLPRPARSSCRNSPPRSPPTNPRTPRQSRATPPSSHSGSSRWSSLNPRSGPIGSVGLARASWRRIGRRGQGRRRRMGGTSLRAMGSWLTGGRRTSEGGVFGGG